MYFIVRLCLIMENVKENYKKKWNERKKNKNRVKSYILFLLTTSNKFYLFSLFNKKIN